MEMRTLHEAEREALLELLDRWDVGDGWRGRDFFRRYVEDDPTFRDENVHVAVEDGRPVSCVQIFPRPLRTLGGPVLMGGIGSVYTDPDFRRRGLSEALIERAAQAMRADEMYVSMLFAERLAWYTKLGWHSYGVRRALVQRDRSADPGAAPHGVEVEPFDRERDLAAVRALHEAYCDLLGGSVVRDDALWEGSLKNAGNPREEFLLARAGGEVVAYLRGVVLSGILCAMEFARTPGFEEALAELFVRLTEEREDDAWARPERRSHELRRVLTTADLAFDPDLAFALGKRSLAVSSHDDPSCMVRCLDADALAASVGVRRRSDESPGDLLARAVPPREMVFWTADRF